MPEKLPAPTVPEDLKLAAELCALQQKRKELRKKLQIKSLSPHDKDTLNIQKNKINKQIVDEIVGRYEPYFIAFVKNRIYTEHYIIKNNNTDDSKSSNEQEEKKEQLDHGNDIPHINDFLQTFYENRILKGLIFCKYKAKNNASLKTFLKKALDFELLTFNSDIAERRKHEITPSDPETFLDRVTRPGFQDETTVPKRHKKKSSRKPDNEEFIGNSPQTYPATESVYGEEPDNESPSGLNHQGINHDHKDLIDPDPIIENKIKKQNIEIFSGILSAGKRLLNEEDLLLVTLRMEEKKFNEIAKIFLRRRVRQGNTSALFNDEMLKKESDRLRQRFARSIIKIQINTARLLWENKLFVEDSDQGLSVADIEDDFFIKQAALCGQIFNEALELMARTEPVEAKIAAVSLRSYSVAEKILLFGKIIRKVKGKTRTQKNSTTASIREKNVLEKTQIIKLTPKKHVELEKLQDVVDSVLEKRNLEMTIDKMLPVIKAKMPVT